MFAALSCFRRSCACDLLDPGPLRAAQTYPAQPIKMIVGFGPGSAADVLIRVVGKQMETSLGQPIVVENRPGNSSMIAADAVMRAPADGYTLFVATIANTLNPAETGSSFNLARDLAPIALLATVPNVLVAHPSVAGEQSGGIDRAREEQAGNPDLRFVRLCHRKLHGGGVVQCQCGHRHRHGALSGRQQPGALGPALGPHHADVQCRRNAGAACCRGQAEGVRGCAGASAHRSCPMFRRWPRPA